jgi:hypothetical protein
MTGWSSRSRYADRLSHESFFLRVLRVLRGSVFCSQQKRIAAAVKVLRPRRAASHRCFSRHRRRSSPMTTR